jgi:hypothetical protein
MQEARLEVLLLGEYAASEILLPYPLGDTCGVLILVL